MMYSYSRSITCLLLVVYLLQLYSIVSAEKVVMNTLYLHHILIQTWPTEAEMAEADRSHKEKKMKKRRLPKGISDYQV